MTFRISRRGALLGAAVLPLSTAAQAHAGRLDVRLLTIPTRLYRTPFNMSEKMDGWVFFLLVEAQKEQSLTPLSLRIAYRAGGTTVREERIGGPALLAIARQDIAPSRLTGNPPSPPLYWPQAFRIHCYVPQAPAVDEMLFALRASDATGRALTIEARLPVVDYEQQTALLFPLKGPCIIAQAGVLSGGHRNRSGCFAIDVLGLDPNYAPTLRTGSDRPEDYAGWGRQIMAPAAGIVVMAQADRPDQPKDGVSDPAYFAPEYPDGGDIGNHVVIDHGKKEYSLLAHMRTGSVPVKAGDRVTQGQPIGEIGNSGDSSGPHLHYQLQNGPRWEYSDGLPMRFGNVSTLTRGSYFNAG